MQVKASLGSHTCPSLDQKQRVPETCDTSLIALHTHQKTRGGTCPFDHLGLQNGIVEPDGSALHRSRSYPPECIFYKHIIPKCTARVLSIAQLSATFTTASIPASTATG